MHPIEFPGFAPIGNRIDRNVEQIGRHLCTIATVTALPAGTGRWPQRTATLDAIGIAQPIDFTGRQRPALPTAVALLIEPLGNLRYQYDPGPTAGCTRSPQALCGGSHTPVSAAGTSSVLQACVCQRTSTRTALLEFGQHDVLHQQAHHVFTLGVGGRAWHARPLADHAPSQ